MPIFDFKCLDCGEEFEALVLKTQPACPGCQSQRLEQQISLFRVDSEGTRDHSMKDAKQRHAKARKEFKIAQQEYEREHRH